MDESPLFFVGKGEHDHFLLGSMANRHGLIAGATGTGKTVSLRVLAEALSREGVPVFMADVKGDLSGMAKAIEPGGKIGQRVTELGLADVYQPEAYPVIFWDVYGEKGHPVRATVSDMGPILLGRLLGLNDTQGDVLSVIFKIADDRGLLLLDLKDLQALVQTVGENLKELRTEYGNMSPATVGAIQRDLLVLEGQGGDIFFGEPMLDIADLFLRVPDGRGVINVLASDKLLHEPKLYSTFLLWLLSELFENLPEVGDQPLPRMVFFFDEAHLLFNDAPKALLDKVEQVVRLIRSKGVGVYFCTQQPTDIPEDVAGQLGNRVQHALRAFTERDRKAVKAAAETFRSERGSNLGEIITQLGVGEAILSFLDEKGMPTVAEGAKVAPPRTQLDPLTDDERAQVMAASPVRTKYTQTVDRVSAYEVLKQRADEAAEQVERDAMQAEIARREEQDYQDDLREQKERERQDRAERRRPQRATPVEAFFGSAARSIGSQVGRQVVRGVLGTLFGGSGGRRRRGGW